MEAIAELIIGSIIKAVRDHALADATKQAEIEATMLAAVSVMLNDRKETEDAHDVRLREALAAIEAARATKP